MYVKVAHLYVWVLVCLLERFLGCPLVGGFICVVWEPVFSHDVSYDVHLIIVFIFL
jgi:hypothetical protein